MEQGNALSMATPRLKVPNTSGSIMRLHFNQAKIQDAEAIASLQHMQRRNKVIKYCLGHDTGYNLVQNLAALSPAIAIAP